MSPDDPRHGTIAGYERGCHDDRCCRSAKRLYDKKRELDRLAGRPRTHSNVGASRRLKALATLGWGGGALAPHLDAVQQEVVRWRAGHYATIRTATVERIARVYEELCMTPPPALTRWERSAAVRAKVYAEKRGWAPPLAWDDIDNDLAPTGVFTGTVAQCQGPSHDSVDHARVERIVVHRDFTLAGEATQGERAAVVARWPGTLNDLERLTGWRVERYISRDGAA